LDPPGIEPGKARLGVLLGDHATGPDWLTRAHLSGRDPTWFGTEQTSAAQGVFDLWEVLFGNHPESTDDRTAVVVQQSLVEQVADDLR